MAKQNVQDEKKAANNPKNVKKPAAVSAAMRKAQLIEEEKKQKEKAKKKKMGLIILVSALVVVIVGCAVGIPLGIKARNNSYRKIELKNLCNDQGNSLSAWVKELNGKKVQVQGYLLECTSYTRFLAGSSNASCPFSTQRYVTNVIPAVYENGDMFSSGIDTQKPYVVYGTLHIGDTVIAQYWNSSKGAYDDEIAGMVLYVERFEKA